MYLSYVGLRVRDLPRSVQFYTGVFGLEPLQPAELTQMDPNQPGGILLRDPTSGLRLELNYYPPGSPYATPYVPGEALDHLAFRVEDLPAALERLTALGFPAQKMAHYDGPYRTTPHFRIAYVRDPDGIELELFDVPGNPPFAPLEY